MYADGFTGPKLAAAIAVFCLAPTVAVAQTLTGTWNTSVGTVVEVSEVYGRFLFRIQSTGELWAQAYLVDDGIEFTRNEGNERLAWSGTILSYRNGDPYRFRVEDGTEFQRADAVAAPPAPPSGGVSPNPPGGAPAPYPFPPASVPSSPPAPGTYPAPGAWGPYPGPLPAPPQMPAFNLTGTWDSNIGFTYRIVQNGSTLRWTVDGTQQLGEGSIIGERVIATWRGPWARGASGGTVRRGAFGPERIEFDNGVVLTFRG